MDMVFESIEKRLMRSVAAPADTGPIITLDKSTGTLRIIGRDTGDMISIYEQDSYVWISNPGGPVRESKLKFPRAQVKSFDIELHGGSDRFTNSVDLPTRADLGSGDDYAFIDNRTSTNVIATGDGNDDITVAGTSTISLGLGSDTISCGDGVIVGGESDNSAASVHINGGGDHIIVDVQDGSSLSAQLQYNSIDFHSGGGDDFISYSATKSALINSAGGNDEIHSNGFNAAAIIYSGSGNDTVISSQADDTVYGELKEDLSQPANDYYEFGFGNKVLVDGSGNNTVFGSLGNDLIRLGGGNDSVDANSGNDTVIVGAGDDTINGDPGRDRLYGGYGNDLILGGANNDVIIDFYGNNRLKGNAGNDLIVARDPNATGEYIRRKDFIDGGSGNDSLLGDSVDLYASIENILASI